MMADWELGDFLDQLPTDTLPIHFFVGEKDKTVPSHISHSWARVMANSTLTECRGLGHLMHEEDPHTLSSMLKNSLN
jgi:magnesium chelatase accessory protein